MLHDDDCNTAASITTNNIMMIISIINITTMVICRAKTLRKSWND